MVVLKNVFILLSAKKLLSAVAVDIGIVLNNRIILLTWS